MTGLTPKFHTPYGNDPNLLYTTPSYGYTYVGSQSYNQQQIAYKLDRISRRLGVKPGDYGNGFCIDIAGEKWDVLVILDALLNRMLEMEEYVSEVAERLGKE